MKAIFVCAAIACVAAAGLAADATAGEKKIAVAYGDLDISKPAGREVFNERIALAARRICGPEPGIARRLREGEVYEACLKDTMNRAVAALPRNVAAKLETAAPVNEAMLH
jgi:UrcA family protein